LENLTIAKYCREKEKKERKEKKKKKGPKLYASAAFQTLPDSVCEIPPAVGSHIKSAVNSYLSPGFRLEQAVLVPHVQTNIAFALALRVLPAVTVDPSPGSIQLAPVGTVTVIFSPAPFTHCTDGPLAIEHDQSFALTLPNPLEPGAVPPDGLNIPICQRTTPTIMTTRIAQP